MYPLPPTHLILDGVGTVRAKLHQIGLAPQPKAVRPHGNASRCANAPSHAIVTSIDTLVRQATANRKEVLIEGLLHVDEGALARAVAVMLDGRDRNLNYL